MTRNVTGVVAGATALGAFAAFWRWHSPPAKPLTSDEIDEYLAVIGKLPLPGDEIDKIVGQLRPWAEADDGRPTYMLNLIRYYDHLRRFDGAPDFDGTPEEANAYYEKSLTNLWLRNASYPMVGGRAQGPNIIETQPGQAPWSTAQMVRYPSRRTFLRLLADPSYGPLEPYKFMALEIDLVPVSGDKVIPDPRWVVGGGLLALALAAGWLGASRRASSC
ncbi:MAG: hypothetical protein WAN48_06210 [Actinomycetes bacterium]